MKKSESRSNYNFILGFGLGLGFDKFLINFYKFSLIFKRNPLKNFIQALFEVYWFPHAKLLTFVKQCKVRSVTLDDFQSFKK